MQLATRVAVAIVAGLLAAGVSYLAAAPVVSSAEVWFAVGLNAIVWAIATGLYLHAWTRLKRMGATADVLSINTAGKWGGVAGGFVSVGTSGVYLLTFSLPFRFVAVVSLFVFGVAIGSMAIGMGVVAARFDARESAGSAAGSPTVAFSSDFNSR